MNENKKLIGLSDDQLRTVSGGSESSMDKNGGEIDKYACCDRFSPRKSLVMPRRECWYCRYADFHLNKPVALEVGICRYPMPQNK